MADTIRTVKPSGGDYTSLAAWEAGQQKVIAAGDTEQAECYAMADTTAVTIDGWTTAANAYIRIYTPASERHAGVWDTSKYRLETATNILSILEDFVRLEGLQLRFTSTTVAATGLGISATGAYDIRVDNCLIRAMDAIANNCNGVLATSGAAGSILRMKNTAIYGWYSAGNFDSCIQINNANVTAHLHNCTFARGNYGVRARSGAVINVKNCYSGATDHGDYLAEGTSVINRTTAASEDATGSAGLQNIAYSTTAGAYFTNITAGSEDFHIGASSALKDVGTDLSADANYAFTDDIDGQTRVAPWDIGADEIVAAAATTTTRRRLRHVIYPVPGPYNPGQFERRRGSKNLTPALIRVISESAQVSESRARVVGIRRVVNDTVQVAESLVRALGLRRIVTEAVNIAESISRVVGIRRVVSEVVNVAESVARFIGLLRARTETVNVAESILNRIGILRVRTETEQVSESTLRFVGLRRIINEAVSVAEAVVRKVGLTRVSTEVANVSENRVRVVGLRRVITEGVQAGESLLRLIGLVRVRAETTSVAETVPRRVGLARILTEAIQVAEAVVQLRGLSRVLTEAVNVAESVVRRLLSSVVYTTAVEFTVRARAAVSAVIRAKPAVDHKTRIRED